MNPLCIGVGRAQIPKSKKSQTLKVINYSFSSPIPFQDPNAPGGYGHCKDKSPTLHEPSYEVAALADLQRHPSSFQKTLCYMAIQFLFFFSLKIASSTSGIIWGTRKYWIPGNPRGRGWQPGAAFVFGCFMSNLLPLEKWLGCNQMKTMENNTLEGQTANFIGNSLKTWLDRFIAQELVHLILSEENSLGSGHWWGWVLHLDPVWWERLHVELVNLAAEGVC